MKLILLFMICLLAGCTGFDSPNNTKYKATFEYFTVAYTLDAYPDSMHLWFVAMNSVTGSEGINFVFKIRGYKGNGNNIGVNFMMPLSDSVTVAWYDDNGDSLPVTLRINPKFFNGIPYGAQDSHTFVHPEDTQNSYSVGVSYYDSTTDVWCKDSSGALLAYSHTLPTGDSVSVPAPDKYCTGVAVIGMNEIGSDSVSNGRVLRTYSSITGGSCIIGSKCSLPGIRLP